MPHSPERTLIRVVVVVAAVAMILIVMGKGISASPSQSELTGQIFIVTKGHESIKLGLVTVEAFDPAKVNASIESTKPLIANEQQRLNQIPPEIHRFYEQTQRAVREAPREGWKSAIELESAAMKLIEKAGCVPSI